MTIMLVILEAPILIFVLGVSGEGCKQRGRGRGGQHAGYSRYYVSHGLCFWKPSYLCS